jgi:hypothetical protein
MSWRCCSVCDDKPSDHYASRKASEGVAKESSHSDTTKAEQKESRAIIITQPQAAMCDANVQREAAKKAENINERRNQRSFHRYTGSVITHYACCDS